MRVPAGSLGVRLWSGLGDVKDEVHGRVATSIRDPVLRHHSWQARIPIGWNVNQAPVERYLTGMECRTLNFERVGDHGVHQRS